jgi:hypothetical protein
MSLDDSVIWEESEVGLLEKSKLHNIIRQNQNQVLKKNVCLPTQRGVRVEMRLQMMTTSPSRPVLMKMTLICASQLTNNTDGKQACRVVMCLGGGGGVSPNLPFFSLPASDQASRS